MILGKKGVIGRMLTTFPVMLLVIFVIGIFLILSALVIVIKGPSIPSTVKAVEIDNFMLEEIKLNEAAVLIIDSILRLEQYGGDISHNALFEQLRDLAVNDGKDYCIAIAHGRDGSIPGNQNSAIGDFYFDKDGKSLSPNSKFRKLREYANQYSVTEVVSLERGKVEISYYYGPCLGGLNNE